MLLYKVCVSLYNKIGSKLTSIIKFNLIANPNNSPRKYNLLLNNSLSKFLFGLNLNKFVSLSFSKNGESLFVRYFDNS